ncbi:MAG: hypothetical protein QOI59_1537 [Gammaproteobacteria bacterium]|jgi:hypothetical protein|nr:hypothetical protein [Gammaproteobacteria bacterium]
METTVDDFPGGLDPDKDLVLPAQPQESEMRESVSVWLFEENGAFGFPRMGIEAEAASWNDRRLQAAFTFPDGRALNGAARGAPPPAIDTDGRPTIIGAGPLSFRCIKPFRRWTMTYEGTALDGTVQEQIARSYGKRGTKPIRLHVDMTMVTPAWVQETHLDPNMSAIEKANAAAMGLGYRFEHHFRAVGTYEIDGKTHEFKGVGTRIHRQSVRRLEGFFGHCWLSAVFPDGSAFGSLAYPPRDGSDGKYSYNDAVIYKDGRLHPARIINAPFLRRIVPAGDEMLLELESDLGRTVIEGTTALGTFRIGNPDIGGLNLQQGGALFRWGNQKAYGMCERSTHESLTTIG